MEGDEFLVVLVGRWLVYGKGYYDFKIDKSRMGRCINLNGISGLADLQRKVRREYELEGGNQFVEFSYWAEDLLTRRLGLEVEPSAISSDSNFRTFRSLFRGDKSINLFATFREFIGSELRIVPPKQPYILEGFRYVLNPARPRIDVGASPLPPSSFVPDPISIAKSNEIGDETLIAHLESYEATTSGGALGHNSDFAVDDPGSADDEEDADELNNAFNATSDLDEDEDPSDSFNLISDGEEELDVGVEQWTAVTGVGVVSVSDDPQSDEEFASPPPSKKLSKPPVETLSAGLKGKAILADRAPVKMAGLATRFKQGISLEDIYGYDDIEPMFDDTCLGQTKANQIDFTKEDDAMFIGREFLTREDFKIALSIYAINRVFRFRFVKFATDFLVAQCVDPRCDWRVTAHRLGVSDEYEVKKAKLDHICDVNTRSQFTKHATSKIVAALLRSKYVNAAAGPRARDLPDILLDENHVRISYWKAWKAKELAVASAQGTEESSYRLLPVYLYVLQLSNPGTIYHLETVKDKLGDDRFKYVFLSLGACVAAVKHIRRVVVVDGTHLHGKFKGVLLTASGQDANFQIVPIAFAVVDSECDLSWTWFMEKLSHICADGPDLTFISDRCQSIYNALAEVFPLSNHGACLVHIRRNVKAKYRKGKVSQLVWRAGIAYRVRDFMNTYQRIKRRNYECWKFLEKMPKSHWTRAYSQGRHYNLMSSNIAEALNKALLPARGSPIVALLEFIRRMISRWFATRRQKISKLPEGALPPAIEKQCLKLFKDSVGCSVMAAALWVYEVTDTDTERYEVNLEDMTCSCLQFQTLNIPCKHALAAAHLRKLDYKTLVGIDHTVSRWVETVNGKILPVKDPDEVSVPENIRVMCLMRPFTKRPPGRPPKLRIPSIGEHSVDGKSQQPNKCGRCRGLGHNRVTCTAPI